MTSRRGPLVCGRARHRTAARPPRRGYGVGDGLDLMGLVATEAAAPADPELRMVVAELPRRHRIALTMHYGLAGSTFSVERIAAVLSTTPDDAADVLAVALAAARSLLGDAR